MLYRFTMRGTALVDVDSEEELEQILNDWDEGVSSIEDFDFEYDALEYEGVR